MKTSCKDTKKRRLNACKVDISSIDISFICYPHECDFMDNEIIFDPETMTYRFRCGWTGGPGMSTCKSLEAQNDAMSRAAFIVNEELCKRENKAQDGIGKQDEDGM